MGHADVPESLDGHKSETRIKKIMIKIRIMIMIMNMRHTS